VHDDVEEFVREDLIDRQSLDEPVKAHQSSRVSPRQHAGVGIGIGMRRCHGKAIAFLAAVRQHEQGRRVPLCQTNRENNGREGHTSIDENPCATARA